MSRLPYANSRYGYYPYSPSSPMPQKFPQDIQCVYPSPDPTKGSIYVSNVEAASNHLTLYKHNIRAVMTCAKGHDRNIPKSKLDMFQYFPFDDKQTCQIYPYFEKASDFIVAALQKTNVLVHCIAGVSRSVSMVLAFLIREKGMSYEEAHRVVKSRRSIISPNDGFIRQLKQYAEQIRDKFNRSTTPKKLQNNYSRHFQTDQKKHNDLHSYQQRVKKSQTFIKYNNNSVHNEQQKSPNHKQFGQQKAQFKQSLADYQFKNMRNQSLTIPRTISFDQYQATPKKYNKPFQHQNLTIQQSKQKSTTYKQMNDELNKKIQAIHAKYEKQRQLLLSKRGYSSGGQRTSYIERPFENNKSLYQNNKYSDNYSGLLSKGTKNKYYDMIQNKYSRGLNFMGLGKTANFPRNRYV